MPKYHWNTLKICLIGQINKQLLRNFEPWKSWKYKQLWELGPDLSCFRTFCSLLHAIIACNHLPFFKICSNFAHFCPNFQNILPFLPFLNIFLLFFALFGRKFFKKCISFKCLWTGLRRKPLQFLCRINSFRNQTSYICNLNLKINNSHLFNSNVRTSNILIKHRQLYSKNVSSKVQFVRAIYHTSECFCACACDSTPVLIEPA